MLAKSISVSPTRHNCVWRSSVENLHRLSPFWCLCYSRAVLHVIPRLYSRLKLRNTEYRTNQLSLTALDELMKDNLCSIHNVRLVSPPFSWRACRSRIPVIQISFCAPPVNDAFLNQTCFCVVPNPCERKDIRRPRQHPKQCVHVPFSTIANIIGAMRKFWRWMSYSIRYFTLRVHVIISQNFKKLRREFRYEKNFSTQSHERSARVIGSFELLGIRSQTKNYWPCMRLDSMTGINPLPFLDSSSLVTHLIWWSAIKRRLSLQTSPYLVLGYLKVPW